MREWRKQVTYEELQKQEDLTMTETVRAAVNEGWQERAKEICHLDNFEVFIHMNPDMGLTHDESERLQSKFDLVAEYARHMAMNMVKGTVKYVTDQYDLETWMVEEEDDHVDSDNYWLLRRQAMQKAGLI